MDTVLGFICSQDDVHLAVVMTSRYDVMDTVLASAYNSLLEFQLLKNSAYVQQIFRGRFFCQLNIFLRLFLEGLYTQNDKMLAMKGL